MSDPSGASARQTDSTETSDGTDSSPDTPSLKLRYRDHLIDDTSGPLLASPPNGHAVPVTLLRSCTTLGENSYFLDYY